MLAHLVVLINPVEGSPANLQPLLSRIQNQSTTAFVPELHNVQVNDGIDFVSAQLYQKVRERLLSDQPKFLSFIGHSVGGIYARIIIKRLADDDCLDTCIPLYFISIGTPHLGSKHWFKGIFADLILGQREKELMLFSNNSKEPLLMRIIDDKHLNALKKFKYLVTYSSTAGDSPYSMESTSIRTHEQLLNLETNGILLNSSLSMEFKETANNDTESSSGKNGQILKALCRLNWFRIEFSGHLMHTLDFWNTEDSGDMMEHLTQLISNPTTDITTNFENPRDGIHLVVLIHGLEGFNTDFQYLACKLRERFSGRVKTLSPDCNHGRTGDGIMNGAKRILECIEIEIKKSSVVYLSLIGHSLGGLYARCVASLLNQKSLFQSRLIPLNFITLATPHLGSREHSKILGSKFTSLLAEAVVGQTGKELMMTDITDSGLPLLLSLVDDLHLNGIRAFKNLAAYSNVKHDPAVHYSTSSIRHRRFETTVDVENLALPAIIVDDFPDAEIIDAAIDKDNFEMKILAKLNLLPWNRYAVIPSRPLLAHVDIIIKSEYWNEQHGYPVIAHLLDNFQHRTTKPGIFRSVSSLIQNQHLIVIVPGHDSISHDLLPFADALRNKYPKPYFNIAIPACNDWKTSDGIAKGSARLFSWLQELLSVSPVSKISFIGESVGGLYARTVVGLLHSARTIPDLIEPCNFITISTQHLGVRKNTNYKLTSKLLSPLMSQTGQQLNLLDDEQYLLMLSSERFVNPLSQFKNLILYFPSKPEQFGYFSTWAISTADEQKLKSKRASTKIIAVDTLLELDDGSTSETPESKIVKQLGQLPWKRYCISSSSHSRKPNWSFSKHHPLLKHILQELKAS